MIEQKLKPSLVLERVIPDYVVDEFPKFVSFIRAYYKFLEQDGQLIGRLNKFLSNMDIHTVSDSDAQFGILSMFLESIPKNLELDYGILIQNIRRFYASRGTEGSIKTFLYLMSEARKPNSVTIEYTGDLSDIVGKVATGTSSGATATILRGSWISGSSKYCLLQVSYTSKKAFFNSEDTLVIDGNSYVVYVEDFNVDIFYPKNYMIRSSSGTYVAQKRCRIEVPNAYLTYDFVGKDFYNSSGSTGRIESVSYNVGTSKSGNKIYDLQISFGTFRGWKDSDEKIFIADIEFVLVTVITGVTVDDGGLGYSISDEFKIVKNGVNVSNIVVDVVTKGKIETILVYNGGSGYSVGDTFSFKYSDGNYGGGWVYSVNNGVIVSAKVYHSKRYSDEYPTITFDSGNDTAKLYPISTSSGCITSAFVDNVLYEIDGTESIVVSDVALNYKPAQFSLITGTLYSTKKSFQDTSGQPSSGYKIQDSDYWQDFSYVLKMNKSVDFSEMSDLYKRFIHPSGTKVFIEYQKMPSRVSINHVMSLSTEMEYRSENEWFQTVGDVSEDTIDTYERIKDVSPLQYFSLPFYIRENGKSLILSDALSFESYSMKLSEINNPIHRYSNVVECYPFEIIIGS